ncbi:hypothetical protein MLGJGCBP_08682 [Rhodococcus sp. T7]|nr:hypothetical protein MLGJGCBP_08682 [Rhodococcus sp. T7]
MTLAALFSEDACTSGRLLRSPCSEPSTLTEALALDPSYRDTRFNEITRSLACPVLWHRSAFDEGIRSPGQSRQKWLRASGPTASA